MGLKFKGDKPQKKKKSSSSRSSAHASGSGSRVDPDAHLEGWLPAPSPALLLGPTYLVLPGTELTPTVCVATNPTTGKVYAHVLPSPGGAAGGAASSSAGHSAAALAHLDADELEALVDPSDAATLGAGAAQHYEPSDVHHVWVCARVLDSNDKVTLRSGAGRFLASDELGRVSAEREARGMQEEWTLEAVASEGDGGRMAIRSAYGKYLSVDVVAGGKVELRADEDKEGETERWRVMMQGEFVVMAKQQFNERNGIKTKPDAGYTVVTDLAGAEVDAIKRFHRHGQGSSSVGTAEDVRSLKKARKEGRLAEAMLDRRAKLKSDRYC